MVLSAGSSLKPHTGVLPVVKGFSLLSDNTVLLDKQIWKIISLFTQSYETQ